MPQLLNKINILSTRPLTELAAVREKNSNICFDCVSFIETQPIMSNDLAKVILHLATQSLYVAFTSANAVSAVTSYIKNIIPNWQIFCISGRTKEYITYMFPKNAILASANNAIILAERIIALSNTKNIIFFCGDQYLNDLPEKLSANGIETKKIIVYKTIATPVAITKSYNGILFFSPSAVQSFFSVNTIPNNVTLFSIGTTTSAAIVLRSNNQIITSPFPSPTALINSAISFYNINSQDNI